MSSAPEVYPQLPVFEAIGAIGFLALAANSTCFFLFARIPPDNTRVTGVSCGYRENEQVARIGKVFSSPKRLELIELLCQGEKTVETLAREAAISVKLASAHLRELRMASLVETERQGKNICYRLAGKAVDDLWGQCICWPKTVWSNCNWHCRRSPCSPMA